MGDFTFVRLGASADDMERAAIRAGVGGTVVFVRGIYDIDRPMRWPRGRAYNLSGSMLRYTQPCDETMITFYELPEDAAVFHPRRSLFERAVRWLRVHILRQRLFDGPGTTLHGATIG